MDLTINFEETIAIGNQVIAKAGEFQVLLNNIKSANQQLQTSWQGQDASKYSQKVAEQAVTMQKLIETINEIGEYVVSVGKAYQEVSENNANAIN
jgi:WXG100 family type VII secretion target